MQVHSQRPELSHAGTVMSTAKAERKRPTGVRCSSDLILTIINLVAQYSRRPSLQNLKVNVAKNEWVMVPSALIQPKCLFGNSVQPFVLVVVLVLVLDLTRVFEDEEDDENEEDAAGPSFHTDSKSCSVVSRNL